MSIPSLVYGDGSTGEVAGAGYEDEYEGSDPLRVPFDSGVKCIEVTGQDGPSSKKINQSRRRAFRDYCGEESLDRLLELNPHVECVRWDLNSDDNVRVSKPLRVIEADAGAGTAYLELDVEALAPHLEELKGGVRADLSCVPNSCVFSRLRVAHVNTGCAALTAALLDCAPVLVSARLPLSCREESFGTTTRHVSVKSTKLRQLQFIRGNGGDFLEAGELLATRRGEPVMVIHVEAPCSTIEDFRLEGSHLALVCGKISSAKKMSGATVIVELGAPLVKATVVSLSGLVGCDYGPSCCFPSLLELAVSAPVTVVVNTLAASSMLIVKRLHLRLERDGEESMSRNQRQQHQQRDDETASKLAAAALPCGLAQLASPFSTAWDHSGCDYETGLAQPEWAKLLAEENHSKMMRYVMKNSKGSGRCKLPPDLLRKPPEYIVHSGDLDAGDQNIAWPPATTSTKSSSRDTPQQQKKPPVDRSCENKHPKRSTSASYVPG